MKNSEVQTVGVIGAGNIVQTMHLPILYSLPQFQVRYLADIHLKPGLEVPFGAERIPLDFEQLPDFPETDIVFLATPPGVRRPYIDLFSKRKEWIFCEKPFAVDLKEHKHALANTSLISANYNRQGYSNVLQLKDIIQDGFLGELSAIKISEAASPRGTGKGSEHYQFKPELGGGGILIERGCHTLSQLDFLFSEYYIEIEQSAIRTIQGIDVDVELTISMQSPTGKSIRLEYILSTGRWMETLSKYRFDRASLQFDHTDPESRLCIDTSSGKKHSLDNYPEGAKTASQSFIESWLRLSKCLLGEDNSSPEVRTSLRTSQWIETAYQQAGIL